MESRKIADEGKLVREKRDEDVRKIMEQLNSSEKIAKKGPIVMIKDEASEIKDKIIEDVQTIKDNLNDGLLPRLKYRIKQIGTDMKKNEVPFASFLVFPFLMAILTYFLCCSCGEDECYWPSLIILPFSISKKALCWTLIQTINLLKKIPCEEQKKPTFTPALKEIVSEVTIVFHEEKDPILMFWILLAFSVLLGILLLGGLIFGLVQWTRNQNIKTLLGINEDGNWVYGSKVQEKAALTAENGKGGSIVCERKSENLNDPGHQ